MNVLIVLGLVVSAHAGKAECPLVCGGFDGKHGTTCPAPCVSYCVSSSCSPGGVCTSDCNGPGSCSCSDATASLDVDLRNSEGLTPLLASLTYNRWGKKNDRPEALVNAGADIHVRSREGRTPLMFAAVMASADMLKLLVSKGAKIDDRDSEGATALLAAAKAGKRESVEYLLSKGARIDDTDFKGRNAAYYQAMDWCKREFLEFLEAKGVSLHVEAQDGTNVMFPCATQNEGVVPWLLKKGLKPDGNGVKLDTPLVSAVLSGNVSIVRQLIQRGANPNAKRNGSSSSPGSSALNCALARRNGTIAKILLGAGAWRIPVTFSLPKQTSSRISCPG